MPQMSKHAYRRRFHVGFTQRTLFLRSRRVEILDNHQKLWHKGGQLRLHELRPGLDADIAENAGGICQQILRSENWLISPGLLALAFDRSNLSVLLFHKAMTDMNHLGR